MSTQSQPSRSATGIRASRRSLLGAGLVSGAAGLMAGTAPPADAAPVAAPARLPAVADGIESDELRPRFVTRLRPGGKDAQVVQCVCKDTDSGEYYMTQNIAASGQDYRSLRITRCSAAGRYIDEMVCVAGGHGDTLSITRDDDGRLWCWFTWDVDDETGKEIYDFVRVPYAAGATVKRQDSEVVSVAKFDEPSGVKSVFAIDQAGDRMVVRKDWGNDYSAPSTYILRKLSDVMADKDEVLATVKTKGGRPPEGPGTAQAFCTLDDHLYVSYGSSTLDSGIFSIQRYGWTSGENDGAIDLSDLGRQVDGEFPSDAHETEGISTYRDAAGRPALILCMGTGAIRLRQAKVYSLAPPEVDVDQGAPLEGLVASIQSGTATVTPSAADADTSLEVEFPYGMPGTPVVQVTPQSNCRVWVTKPTGTGCTIWVNSSDGDDVVVGWIAHSPAQLGG